DTASAVARVLGVDAAFGRGGGLPGEIATPVAATDATRTMMQILHVGPEPDETWSDDEIKGVPVSDPVTLDWTAHGNGPAPIEIDVRADWPSGVYAARRDADDGRVGFAPLVVRPARPASRVAVVIPTSTWAAYNFFDADGDGWGDTWYARWSKSRVDLTRPRRHAGRQHRTAM